ncbi:unnamed protein product, partial [Sphacelaria rigidula]
MRQSGGDRYNRVGPLMATSTSPPSISERDIMREFASAAADEARGHSSSSNAGRGDGGPAGVDGGGVSAKGGDDRGGTAAAAAVAPEDLSRPTGYRYGDVLTDNEGLPLVYDSDCIGRYWDKRPGEVS